MTAEYPVVTDHWLVFHFMMTPSLAHMIIPLHINDSLQIYAHRVLLLLHRCGIPTSFWFHHLSIVKNLRDTELTEYFSLLERHCTGAYIESEKYYPNKYLLIISWKHFFHAPCFRTTQWTRNRPKMPPLTLLLFITLCISSLVLTSSVESPIGEPKAASVYSSGTEPSASFNPHKRNPSAHKAAGKTPRIPGGIIATYFEPPPNTAELPQEQILEIRSYLRSLFAGEVERATTRTTPLPGNTGTPFNKPECNCPRKWLLRYGVGPVKRTSYPSSHFSTINSHG